MRYLLVLVFYHRQGVLEKWVGGKIEVKHPWELMVSLLWSGKLTAIGVTHCFLLIPAPCPHFLSSRFSPGNSDSSFGYPIRSEKSNGK